MRETLKRILIHDEDKIPHAYPDSEGYWTIGVGRLIDKRKGGHLTEDEMMYLLNNDIDRVLSQCATFDWFDGLSDNRKVVIASMVFNLGLPKFRLFRRTIDYIRRGMYANAADEMLDSKWAKQVGQRAYRLSNMMREG